MQGAYLTDEEVFLLLGGDYISSQKIERSIYQSKNGELIAVLSSKLYDDKTFWYSCVTDYFAEKGIQEVYLIAGYQGLIRVPIIILKEYCKHSGWKKQKKGRSYYVRVKWRNEKYILFSSEGQDIDVTDYFISSQDK